LTLLVSGTQASSVFRLNGTDENSASLAVGWTLESSREFLSAVVEEIFGARLDTGETDISVQKHAGDGGFTDIEIIGGQQFHAILEAKYGWGLPTHAQLARYRPRLAGADHQRLVSVSAADPGYAVRRLPEAVDGVTVVHLSWRKLQQLAAQSHSRASSFEEKLWLRHLNQHLREFVAMDRRTDNTVYVVSLGVEAMNEGENHTWIDVVEKDGRYFHRVGHGWPVQPPNYIGFRYHGKLQSVHHVDSFETTDNLRAYNSAWVLTDSPHFIYHLGPPMRPPSEVRTGKIFRNGRVYCAIDTLLSGAFKTIGEARDETKRRLEKAL
jgi:hypothetical protein